MTISPKDVADYLIENPEFLSRCVGMMAQKLEAAAHKDKVKSLLNKALQEAYSQNSGFKTLDAQINLCVAEHVGNIKKAITLRVNECLASNQTNITHRVTTAIDSIVKEEVSSILKTLNYEVQDKVRAKIIEQFQGMKLELDLSSILDKNDEYDD